jgi:hypothetical protein
MTAGRTVFVAVSRRCSGGTLTVSGGIVVTGWRVLEPLWRYASTCMAVYIDVLGADHVVPPDDRDDHGGGPERSAAAMVSIWRFRAGMWRYSSRDHRHTSRITATLSRLWRKSSREYRHIPVKWRCRRISDRRIKRAWTLERATCALTPTMHIIIPQRHRQSSRCIPPSSRCIPPSARCIPPSSRCIPPSANRAPPRYRHLAVRLASEATRCTILDACH